MSSFPCVSPGQRLLAAHAIEELISYIPGFAMSTGASIGYYVPLERRLGRSRVRASCSVECQVVPPSKDMQV